MVNNMYLHTINHPVQIGFDVVDFPQLLDRTYRILWASIKYQHLTDQYFKAKIAELTRQIKKRNPQEFKDFLKLVKGSGLTMYGKKQRNNYYRNCSGQLRRERNPWYRPLDKKWWRHVWNLIKYNGDIELERVYK